MLPFFITHKLVQFTEATIDDIIIIMQLPINEVKMSEPILHRIRSVTKKLVLKLTNKSAPRF